MDSSSSKDPKGKGKEKEMLVDESGGKRKGNSSEATSQPQARKPKKVYSSKSPYWKHFTRRVSDPDNYCNCNYCGNPLKCPSSNGTSVLSNHLKSCKEYLSWEDGQTGKQPVINENGELMAAKISEADYRKATNKLMVLGELPLSFVENVAWKVFCHEIKMYTPHSRRTATRDITKLYGEKKEELMNMIKSKKQRVSLTTDIWKSDTTSADYMVVTCHFIDSNWELQKYIIAFKNVSDHKGQTIAQILLEVCLEWGIEKVFTITVDNATANTSAMKKFHTEFQNRSPDALILGGAHLHLRCAAHIINLIAKEGLSDLGDSVEAIRNGVVYLRGSSNRLDAFALKLDRARVSRGSLPLDVSTRWNSTFLMLTRAIQFRLGFDKMEEEDKLYNDYFLELIDGSKRIGPPSVGDWNAVERLINFLVMFYDSTLIVSSSTKINSYKCYSVIVDIERNLEKMSRCLDTELSIQADDMLQKFRKYWDGMKNINKMLVLASAFDPRQKLNYVQLCFDKLYGTGTTQAKAMYDSTYVLLCDMFKEYNGRLNRGSSSSSMPSSQTSQSTQSDSPMAEVEDRMELSYGNFQYEKIDDVYKELIKEIGVADRRNELEIYLKEPVEDPIQFLGSDWNILSWWRVNSGKYPVLSEMARDLLAMQVSSVASESAFSTSGRVLSPCRSCLTHFHIEVLMCLEQWLKCKIRFNGSSIVTNEEMLADVEMLDDIQNKFEKNTLEDD